MARARTMPRHTAAPVPTAEGENPPEAGQWSDGVEGSDLRDHADPAAGTEASEATAEPSAEAETRNGHGAHSKHAARSRQGTHNGQEHHSVFEERSVLDALWSAVVAAPTSITPTVPDQQSGSAPAEPATAPAPAPGAQPEQAGQSPQSEPDQALLAGQAGQPEETVAEPVPAPAPAPIARGTASVPAASRAVPEAPAVIPAAPPVEPAVPLEATAPVESVEPQAVESLAAAPLAAEPLTAEPLVVEAEPAADTELQADAEPQVNAAENLAEPPVPPVAPQPAVTPRHAADAGAETAGAVPRQVPPASILGLGLPGLSRSTSRTNRTIWAGPRHAAPHDWNSTSALLTIETPAAITDGGLLVLRLIIGLTMAAHGAQKAFGAFGGPGLHETANTFASLGYQPGMLFALAAIVGELFGGLLLAAGLLTPLAAGGIIGVTVNAMVSVNSTNGFFATHNGIELPLVISGAALALLLAGPGRYAADARIPFFNGAAVQVAAACVAMFALLTSLAAHLL